jgi:hypothetical protein
MLKAFIIKIIYVFEFRVLYDVYYIWRPTSQI